MTLSEDASAALERGEWDRVLEIVGDERTDEILQLRAAACYGSGDLEGAVSAWEELHADRRSAGDLSGAAWAAGMVALHLLIDTGLMSAVRAWLRRAGELLGDDQEDPAVAVVAMVGTYERFLSGDAAGARELAQRAIALGQRLDVRAAIVIGRTALGRLDVIAGDVAQGLRGLDDVAVQLMGGEVDPLTTGMMYCELICAAQGLGRHDLAREWTELMDRWRHGAAFGGLHGRCRVHRAELLRLSGPGEAAELEALGAYEELRPWMRRELGWPLVELGTIRRLRGDLDGAEQAYLDAHQLVWSPQPGLALLRLEQGHRTVAQALITDAIEHPAANPSKEQPPFGDLRLVPLLAAQSEIAAACDDVDTTRQAAEALTDIAARYDSASLNAEAHVAHARLSLLEVRVEDALASALAAVEAWATIGSPLGTGTGRVLSGRAYELAGNRSRAELEWTAARRDFQAYGATRAVDAVTRLIDRVGPEPSTGTTPDPRDPDLITFARSGDCRRIVWRSVEVLAPDLKGFRYLDRLLARPGEEVHVMDLVSTELARAHDPVSERDLTTGFQSGLPVIDDQARDAYRRRLADVEADVDEAEAAHDLGRLARAEQDRDHLVAELTRAYGLDGRARTTGGDVERARGSVTRSVRYAVRRLIELHPEVGAHLDQHVRTGTYCSYRPDPLHLVRWDLG